MYWLCKWFTGLVNGLLIYLINLQVNALLIEYLVNVYWLSKWLRKRFIDLVNDLLI